MFVKAYFELCTRSEEQAHFGRCSTGKSLQVVVSMQSTFSFKTLTRQDDLDFRQPYVHVTECIFTLCLCCCMYSVCVALSVFFRMSIFYLCVTCCDLDVTLRRHDKSEREKARGNNNDLSYIPSKRKEEIKSGTYGCGSFVFPYFQPATSTTDRLHPYQILL